MLKSILRELIPFFMFHQDRGILQLMAGTLCHVLIVISMFEYLVFVEINKKRHFYALLYKLEKF